MWPRLAEAWFLATVLLAGLAVGSLGLLLLGRLLGRRWLTPIDDELEPAASTLPLVLLLAAPLAPYAGRLFGTGAGLVAGTHAAPHAALAAWFDTRAIVARAAAYLVVWSAVALWVRRRRDDVRSSAVGLAVLLPTASLAGLDWVLGRPPFWWSGLLGFAFAASQLAPALALAFLANSVSGEHVERLHDESLRTTLLTVSLATLGLWFLQFLTAWMGNLPDAAAWYRARSGAGRDALLASASAMLIVAIVLLLHRGRANAPVVAAAALILGQHVLHTTWLLRPAGTPPLAGVDVGVFALLAAVWAVPYVASIARRERAAAERGAGADATVQSGRSGSS